MFDVASTTGLPDIPRLRALRVLLARRRDPAQTHAASHERSALSLWDKAPLKKGTRDPPQKRHCSGFPLKPFIREIHVSAWFGFPTRTACSVAIRQLENTIPSFLCVAVTTIDYDWRSSAYILLTYFICLGRPMA